MAMVISSQVVIFPLAATYQPHLTLRFPCTAPLHHPSHHILRHRQVHAHPPRICLCRLCSEPSVRAHGEGKGVEGREWQAPADAGVKMVEGHD